MLLAAQIIANTTITPKKILIFMLFLLLPTLFFNFLLFVISIRLDPHLNGLGINPPARQVRVPQQPPTLLQRKRGLERIPETIPCPLFPDKEAPQEVKKDG
jgi:hypothetical protein